MSKKSDLLGKGVKISETFSLGSLENLAEFFGTFFKQFSLQVRGRRCQNGTGDFRDGPHKESLPDFLRRN